MKIGEFSKLTNFSVRTLRHYERLGLLEPVYVDCDSSYRYYTEEQLLDANRIQTLKQCGFSLGCIQEILHQKDERRLLDIYDQRQLKIEKTLDEIALESKKLHYIQSELVSGFDITRYPVNERKRNEKMLFSKRVNIGAYEKLAKEWEKFIDEVQSLHVPIQKPYFFRSLCHDYKEGEPHVDIEFQVEVQEGAPSVKGYELKTCPAHNYVSIIFMGGIGEEAKIRQALMNYLDIKQLSSRKEYLFNSPYIRDLQTVDPSIWVKEWGIILE